ncbi:MAG TPA: sulfur transferase domain-containing protein [Chroococcidiopsis sp.]
MTDSIQPIGDDFSASGQPSASDLPQIAQAGFRSILNVRSPQESDSFADEAEQAESAGLAYAHVPLSNADPQLDQVQRALAELENLPKPVLIHCGAGGRAGAIALIASAVQAGLTIDQLIATATEAGISLEQPHLKEFIENARQPQE